MDDIVSCIEFVLKNSGDHPLFHTMDYRMYIGMIENMEYFRRRMTPKYMNEREVLRENIIFIDTESDVVKYTRDIMNERMISVDCEGYNLCRRGTISLIQIATKDKIYVFDITVLKDKAFELGLKGILTSHEILKLFFDARNDCDALYNLYYFIPKYFVDVQVLCMEEVYNRGNLCGVLSSIYRSFWVSDQDVMFIKGVKEKGRRIYRKNNRVFDQRPLMKSIVNYAAEDARLIYNLFCEFFFRVRPNVDALIVISEARSYIYAMRRNGKRTDEMIGWTYSDRVGIDENKRRYDEVYLLMKK
jgi:exonuclease 3'-5' domain-containing protein 1